MHPWERIHVRSAPAAQAVGARGQCTAFEYRGVPTSQVIRNTITFNHKDHPKSTMGVDQLPLVVSLTICNIKVTNMLVDGGACLYPVTRRLREDASPPKAFATNKAIQGWVTIPIGHVSLMVTFGIKDTEPRA